MCKIKKDTFYSDAFRETVKALFLQQICGLKLLVRGR